MPINIKNTLPPFKNGLHASISRNKHNKEARLKVVSNLPWQLFCGSKLEEIDYSKPILKGSGSGIFNLSVSSSFRSYFVLRCSAGEISMAETHLPMSGGYNFCDLGGIKTHCGQTIAWGKLIRADDLHNLTSLDLTYLATIPLTTIVDFRTLEEIELAPDKKPNHLKQHVALSIQPGQIDLTALEKLRECKNEKNFMLSAYAMIIEDAAIQNTYRNFFKLLQNSCNLPLLFHCSAGKDRTGMAAAYILFALGVPKELVMENYLASNQYLEGKYSFDSDLYRVHPEYLQTAITKMEQSYGSVKNFLTQVLGVDIAKMCSLFLE